MYVRNFVSFLHTAFSYLRIYVLNALLLWLFLLWVCLAQISCFLLHLLSHNHRLSGVGLQESVSGTENDFCDVESKGWFDCGPAAFTIVSYDP